MQGKIIASETYMKMRGVFLHGTPVTITYNNLALTVADARHAWSANNQAYDATITYSIPSTAAKSCGSHGQGLRALCMVLLRWYQ